ELPVRAGVQHFSGHSRARGRLGSDAILDYQLSGLRGKLSSEKGWSDGQAPELSAFDRRISSGPIRTQTIPGKRRLGCAAPQCFLRRALRSILGRSAEKEAPPAARRSQQGSIRVALQDCPAAECSLDLHGRRQVG